MPNAQWTRVSFERGVDEFYEGTDLSEGTATAISNWTPEATGVLRTKRGWLNAPTSGLTGTRTWRGQGYFVPGSGAKFVAAQASDATTYKINRLAADLSGGWTTIETLTVADSTSPVCFASGADKVLYTNPGFTGDLIRYWDGTTAGTVSADTIAGQFVHYHNNRFFTGGADTNPTYLRWSELGDPTLWSLTTNFQPLGQDDGEPLEDACTWERGMFVGKRNSIWFVSGFGPDTFGFNQVPGCGVAPGRTLVPTPRGVIAIGRERIYSFTGGGFEPISRPIEASYGMSGTYMTGTYIDGRVYVCDQGSGTIWSYDLETGAWASEAYVVANDGPAGVFSRNGYLFGGTMVGGTTSGTSSVMQYRQEPKGARARNINYAETFAATSARFPVRGDKPVGPSTLRNVALTIRQRGGTSASTPLTVQIYTDNVLMAARTVTLKDTPKVFRAQVSAGYTGYDHQIAFSQALGSTDAGVIDIEECWAELEAERAR